MKKQRSNDSSPSKLQSTTMAAPELCDDLIIQIIAHLPPKYAVQCSVLNKSLRRQISGPSFRRQSAEFSSINNSTVFHCSLRYPKIFAAVSPHKSPNPDLDRIENLDAQTSIRASCNGLLLLAVLTHPDSYYVFNPFTRGIAPVGISLKSCHGVGLAADAAADDYRVVKAVVSRRKSDAKKSFVEFSVNSPRTSRVSRKNFVCDKITLTDDRSIRSVYAHGCLHWLERDGRKILVFDVENERGKIIDGPVKRTGIPPGADSPWFGFADGAMQFIYAVSDKIIIHRHDCWKDEWRVQHEIGNVCSPSNNDYRHGLPMFFDGRQVFVYMRKRREDGEVQVYDIETKVWDKRGYVRGWTDWERLCISYFPTWIKVSDNYLRENRNTWENAAFKNSLFGLRRLLIL